MLVGSCVIDDIGMIGAEHLVHLSGISHRSDQHHQVQTGILLSELQLYLVSGVLIHIEYYELFGSVGGHLPAELRTYASASAGDQDHLVSDAVEDLAHVHPYGIATQKVFDIYVLKIVYCDFIVYELIHSGNVLQFAVRLLADVQDISPCLACGAGYGQIYLVYVVFFDVKKDVVPVAYHRHSFDVPVPLVGIVIDEADYLAVVLSALVHVPDQGASVLTCSDYHDPVAVLLGGLAGLGEKLHEPVGESYAKHQYQLEHRAHNIV